MKLSFLGATQTVTGSRYLLEVDYQRVLIDCGLFQGHKTLRQRNWENFAVSPTSIKAIILTHAHLDHSGYLPLLVKQGFRGKIYATAATVDLCKLLLPDSGYLQQEDAARANRYGYTRHQPAKPLYTRQDAEACLAYFEPVRFGFDYPLSDPFTFRFERAGHILGAASVLIRCGNRRVLFSGDLGRPDDPVIVPPSAPPLTDFLVLESTYGNRLHAAKPVTDQLEIIIKKTIARGGSILVPAFAVGRAQNLLYFIHELKRQHRIPDLPVYLDSPMAIDATQIMLRHPHEHRLSPDLCSVIAQSATYVRSIEDSKALNNHSFPNIIIAASGMATGGRVLHHLKYMAPDHRNTILFAGFQAAGTRGDRLLRGEKEIKIHGGMVPVHAEVLNLQSVSAHADYREILGWLERLPTPPARIFITHGEIEASEALKQHIFERFPSWPCVIPEYGSTVTL